MRLGISDGEIYEAIADAIRARANISDRMLPREMAQHIHDIPTAMGELINSVPAGGSVTHAFGAGVTRGVASQSGNAFAGFDPRDMPTAYDATVTED